MDLKKQNAMHLLGCFFIAMKGEFYMSAINEEIVTGRKFRKLVDETTKKWQRFSIWNTAADTECEDGESVEEKLTQLYSNLGGFSIYNDTLTQAEYDALSSDIKNTPKKFFVIV